MATILIVEDHKDFRQALRYFLEVSNINATLLEASSGEEGVQIAKKTKPEIILIDFWLRGINGLEASLQIKESISNCSIIMLTMFDVKFVESLASKGIIKEFISKNDLYEKLVPVINKFLNSASKIQTPGGV